MPPDALVSRRWCWMRIAKRRGVQRLPRVRRTCCEERAWPESRWAVTSRRRGPRRIPVAHWNAPPRRTCSPASTGPWTARRMQRPGLKRGLRSTTGYGRVQSEAANRSSLGQRSSRESAHSKTCRSTNLRTSSASLPMRMAMSATTCGPPTSWSHDRLRSPTRPQGTRASGHHPAGHRNRPRTSYATGLRRSFRSRTEGLSGQRRRAVARRVHRSAMMRPEPVSRATGSANWASAKAASG